MQLVAEHDTELLPENQPAEAFKTLSRAKHELAGSLEKFRAQTEEIESNEERLAGAQKEQQDLLAAEMDEQEQIGKISQAVARQRLLGAKIEQGLQRLESAETGLRQAIDETYKSFGRALDRSLPSREPPA